MDVSGGIMYGDLYDPPWYDDVRVLWNRPTEFFPTATQSDDERFNAVVRLVAYAAVGCSFVRGTPKMLVFGAAVIAFLSLSYRVGKKTMRNVMSEPYAHLTPGTVQRRPQKCTPPTADNPFMNATVGSLMADPGRASACPYSEVKNQVWKGFDNGLFKNLEDVYDVENSQRQYYVMPVTTSAPDTIAFAQFCYGSKTANESTCKEDTSRCAPRGTR